MNPPKSPIVESNSAQSVWTAPTVRVLSEMHCVADDAMRTRPPSSWLPASIGD